MGQSSPAASPVELPNRPASHGSGALLPTSQKLAAWHGSHPVALRACWWVPPGQLVHSAPRVVLAYVPALHAAGLAAPPAHANPTAQSKQSGTPSESEMLPYLPGSQLAGSSRLDPTGQKLPSLHGKQATVPSAPWCDPASHGAHRSLRLDGAYEPAAQGVGAVAPSGQKLPVLHAAHSSAPPRSVVLPCDPLGQGNGALEPGRQYDPC
jgi:hypothetical protein